jgi:hypothetical protein
MVGKLFGHVKTRKIRLSWDKLTMAKEKGGLGYKDLYTFNLAMSANQAWRLLTNPDSLCAHVMKARYFPDCSIFEAQAQSGISYPWRSILKGIEVLRQGVIKRVGNGETINIWQDPWLPRPWSRRPITVRGQRVVNKVSELMDPAAGTWDEALVKDIFCAHDAQLILSIPIFEDTIDDWAWHFDEKGLFSVKSAYHLQRQLLEVQLGQVESSDQSSGFQWKQIWQAECTPNIKQFLWRIAHNSLPFRLNLQRRGMDIDPVCPSCNRLNEDGCHLFLRCKAAKEIWRSFGMEEIRNDLIQCNGPQEMISHVLQLTRSQKLLVLALLWWRWKDRNKVVAGEKPNTEISLIHLIRNTAHDFDQFCTKEQMK